MTTTQSTTGLLTGRTPATLRNWRAKRSTLPYVTSSAGRFAGYRESDVQGYIAALTVVELAR